MLLQENLAIESLSRLIFGGNSLALLFDHCRQGRHPLPDACACCCILGVLCGQCGGLIFAPPPLPLNLDAPEEAANRQHGHQRHAEDEWWAAHCAL
ncbi:MAG TPA: hypothetical protein VHC22_28480 [Pirellulales bacterium]|nr:hypothetical protein [Pirellulales bacterium]